MKKAGKDFHILVIDDEQENLELLSGTLRGTCKISTAKSYNEALDILENNEIDMILADNRLPGRSGTDLLIEAHRRWPNTVRILMTAFLDTDTVTRALNEAQIHRLILKPWTPQEVKNIVLLELDRYKTAMKAASLARKLKSKNKELSQVNEELMKQKQELEKLVKEYQRHKHFYADLAKKFQYANKELAHMRQKLEEANRRLQELSITDGLTGLFNYRHLYRLLKVEFHRALRYELPLSCIMIDLDLFKKVNDAHGHLNGDRVLQAVSEIIKTNVRRTDFAFRYGGDEFFILSPNTSVDEAATFAERLRSEIEQHEFSAEQVTFNQTASIGVAGIPHPDIKSDRDLLQKVDEAMYEAKKLGRNQRVAFR